MPNKKTIEELKLMDEINNFEVMMLLEGKGVDVVLWNNGKLKYIRTDFEQDIEIDPN